MKKTIETKGEWDGVKKDVPSQIVHVIGCLYSVQNPVYYSHIPKITDRHFRLLQPSALYYGQRLKRKRKKLQQVTHTFILRIRKTHNFLTFFLVRVVERALRPYTNMFRLCEPLMVLLISSIQLMPSVFFFFVCFPFIDWCHGMMKSSEHTRIYLHVYIKYFINHIKWINKQTTPHDTFAMAHGNFRA